jgi:hypothetical protein
MATAPKPGARKREEAKRATLRIALKGETRELHMSDLGPGDDRVSRAQTGFPVMPYFNGERFGADSILVLWWMARRKSGEPDLRYAEVEAEFPSYDDLEGVEIEEVSEEPSPEG